MGLSNSQDPPEPLFIETQLANVVHLRLNRPRARNALSLELMLALEAKLNLIGNQSTIRAIVLSGEGPVFSSGHDLKELTAHRADADKGEKFFHTTFSSCARLMQLLHHLPQPVIAAVEGLATAAGCQLVASCDLAIAGAEAHFCTPGVDIGLFCLSPMVALQRSMTPKQALHMLLSGDKIDAETARQSGLINQVAPQGKTVSSALALAERLASKPARAMALGKASFYAMQSKSRAESYDLASASMTCSLLDAEAITGIGAFLTRQKPKWPYNDEFES